MTRQIGRIKWFGGVNRKTGRENHFGVIAHVSKTDLYVHRRDVRCAIKQLTEGVPVTFEPGGESGSLYAVAVGLLQDETDPKTLITCFWSNDYTRFVAQRYLDALNPDQAIAVITRRFPSLDQEQQDSWLHHIIAPRLTLYPLLPFEQQIRFCKRRVIQEEPEARLAVAKEIIEAVKQQLAAASQKSAIINQVPRPVLYLSEAAILRSYLPTIKRLQICLDPPHHNPHADYALEEAIVTFQDAYAIPPAFHKIRQLVFGHFQRCLYPYQKFDSDAERKLAVILEREAEKWFKPVLGQLQIYYKSGIEQKEYQPDFVAETANTIYLLEPKAAHLMSNDEVLAKRDAAVTWCRHASDHAVANEGKPWQYALIPHDAIAKNMMMAGLVAQYRCN